MFFLLLILKYVMDQTRQLFVVDFASQADTNLCSPPLDQAARPALAAAPFLACKLGSPVGLAVFCFCAGHAGRRPVSCGVT
jgi:hypothetical protein